MVLGCGRPGKGHMAQSVSEYAVCQPSLKLGLSYQPALGSVVRVDSGLPVCDLSLSLPPKQAHNCHCCFLIDALIEPYLME